MSDDWEMIWNEAVVGCFSLIDVLPRRLPKEVE
jgi:hypothetical protein